MGKKAWKITLLPKDCGRNIEGDYSDCKNNGKDAVVGHGGGDHVHLQGNILVLKPHILHSTSSLDVFVDLYFPTHKSEKVKR